MYVPGIKGARPVLAVEPTPVYPTTPITSTIYSLHTKITSRNIRLSSSFLIEEKTLLKTMVAYIGSTHVILFMYYDTLYWVQANVTMHAGLR